MLSAFKGLSLIWRIIVTVLVVVALIWAGAFVRSLIIGDNAVKARLGTEQTDAALNSGRDAVNTAGNVANSADELDKQAGETKSEVDKAEDTHGAHSAGSSGLCDDFGICADD